MGATASLSIDEETGRKLAGPAFDADKWAAAEKDADGNVSQALWNAQLGLITARKSIAQLDLDGDGQLDAAEFAAGTGASLEEAAEIIADADANHDGKLSAEELASFALGEDDEDGATIGGSPGGDASPGDASGEAVAGGNSGAVSASEAATGGGEAPVAGESREGEGEAAEEAEAVTVTVTVTATGRGT